MAMPACSAARAMPAQPRSDRFTETKSGRCRQAASAAARGERIGVDRGRRGDTDRQPRNGGADRRYRGIARLGVHCLYPASVGRMDVHGKRPSGLDRDRVGGELLRRQWHDGMLGPGTAPVQTRHHRHRSRLHPMSAGRPAHLNGARRMTIGGSLTHRHPCTGGAISAIKAARRLEGSSGPWRSARGRDWRARPRSGCSQRCQTQMPRRAGWVVSVSRADPRGSGRGPPGT